LPTATDLVSESRNRTPSAWIPTSALTTEPSGKVAFQKPSTENTDIRSAANTAEILQEIDWYQFEKLMERLLEFEGYHVTRFGGAKPDGGIDLLAKRNNKKIIVQCKHWKDPLRPNTIREAVGIRHIHQADELVLATLNSGTPAALALAEQQGIILTSGAEVFRRMQLAGLEHFKSYLDPTDKHCPSCDAPMVFHTGNWKSFWGCSNYGRNHCRGKIET
jgi:restriction system protein